METDYSQSLTSIMNELKTCLSSVEGSKVNELVAELSKARRVFAVGVGRVQLMLEAFVKRLNHIGIEAYYVGQIDEPAITSKDLLIVASGSGESVIPVAIAKVAQRYKPTIAYIGSNVNSTVAKAADLIVRIPCRTKLGLEDEMSSIQPMSSLFEQSLLLICDIVAFMIIQDKKIDMSLLWEKHANLE